MRLLNKNTSLIIRRNVPRLVKGYISKFAAACLLIFFSRLFITSCESNDNIITTVNPYVKPNSKVLVELFTNTSCLPCVAANTYLDDINKLSGVTNNDTNVIIIRIHTSLFPGDPFYLFNTKDNGARIQYYNVITNPRGYLNGVTMGNYSSGTWTSLINTQLAVIKPISFLITPVFDTVSYTGTVNLQVAQTGAVNETDLRLYLAIVEDSISYNAPNGETLFENVLRYFLTSENGDPIILTQGQTNNFVYNFTISQEINFRHTHVVAFIQSCSMKTIFGVDRIRLVL